MHYEGQKKSFSHWIFFKLTGSIGRVSHALGVEAPHVTGCYVHSPCPLPSLLSENIQGKNAAFLLTFFKKRGGSTQV